MTTKTDCTHHWLYEHTLIGASNEAPDDRCIVHRQCADCGIHQNAMTAPWRAPFYGVELCELRTQDMIRDAAPEDDHDD